MGEYPDEIIQENKKLRADNQKLTEALKRIEEYAQPGKRPDDYCRGYEDALAGIRQILKARAVLAEIEGRGK